MKAVRAGLWGFLIIFLAAAVGIPVLAVLARALSSTSDGGAPSLVDPVVLAIAGATAGQAFLSTLGSALIGIPLAWAVFRASESSRRMRAISQLSLGFPFGVPTIVVGMVGVDWLARDWLFSLKAVIATHVFLNAPWVALRLSQAWLALPLSSWEAARTLGASPLRAFIHVSWPELRRTLVATLSQVFGLCVMSFALVLLLGGGPPVETLETSIYSRVRFGSLDFAGAAACAFWELLLCLGPWALWMTLDSRAPRGASPEAFRSARRFPTGGSMLVASICLVFVLPYLGLLPQAARTFLREPLEFTEGLLGPLWVSVRLAVAVTALTLALSMAAAALVRGSQSRAARVLWLGLSFPAGVSTLVLALGFWLAFGRWIDPFDGSWIAMITIQSALFLPWVLRNLWPLVQDPWDRLVDAARTLGASPVHAFLAVEWPRWKPVVLLSAAQVMAASFGEAAAVSLFSGGELQPLPWMIAQEMGRYQFERAQAIAGAVLAATSLPWILTAWLGARGSADA